jgi:hypothetical protein
MKQLICFLICSVFIGCVFTASAQGIWGSADSRTEMRQDAGLQGNQGAKSGFFEATAPVNFPIGANDWWHLLDVRHSNLTNNYAMQFAGSFFDQLLYFRKTNGNPAQPWSRVLTESNGTLGTNTGDNLEMLKLYASVTGNASYLKILQKRFANGNDWMTASTRIQCFTDVTPQGYIDFNPPGVWEGRYGLAFGSGNGTEYMRLNANGNVGIGTDNPQAKLAVNGDVFAKKVKVTLSGWPDYVFEKKYKLPSLAAVAAFVKQYKHLPDVPAAATIEKEGVDIGATQAVLLRKIEELTLYIIQQQKEIDAIKAMLKVKN